MVPRPPWIALLAALLVLLAAAPAGAFRLGGALDAVRDNPAERLAGVRPDDVVYDHARRCTPRARRRGTELLVRWLEEHARGQSWGTYRCERWGRGSASLHAERRAVDWHLDSSRPADKREARRLIRLLLAPDRTGTPQALARRMGIQEIIWDCSYWGAGMEEFTRYRACFSRRGTPRRRMNRTVAHRDHLHIGLSRRGAAGRTSFWRR